MIRHYSDTLKGDDLQIYWILHHCEEGLSVGDVDSLEEREMQLHIELDKQKLIRFRYNEDFYEVRPTAKGKQFFEERFGRAEETFNRKHYPSLYKR